MISFKRPFIHLLCLLFIPLLLSCSEDETAQNCLYTADDTFQLRFYAEWVSSDSVRVILHYFYKQDFANPVQPYSGLQATISQSGSPVGGWAEIWRNTKMYFRDTLTIHTAQPGEMQYFKLDLDVHCGGSLTPMLHDYLIATVCPYSPPTEWGHGPELAFGYESFGYRGESAISQDGRAVCLSIRDGYCLFKLDTGSPLHGSPIISQRNYGFIEWNGDQIVTYLFEYIHKEHVQTGYQSHQMSPFPETIMISNDDSTAILIHMYQPYWRMYDFRTKSINRYLKVDPVLDALLRNRRVLYSFSPGYRHYGFRIFDNTNDMLVYNNDLSEGMNIEPFAGHNKYSQFPANFSIVDIVYACHAIAWISDDVLLVWTTWTGSRELWAYSIDRKKYWQVTGFTPKGLEGNYNERHDTFIRGSVNCVYDPTRNNIILFLIKDDFTYAVRFVDPPQ